MGNHHRCHQAVRQMFRVRNLPLCPLWRKVSPQRRQLILVGSQHHCRQVVRQMFRVRNLPVCPQRKPVQLPRRQWLQAESPPRLLRLLQQCFRRRHQASRRHRHQVYYLQHPQRLNLAQIQHLHQLLELAPFRALLW